FGQNFQIGSLDEDDKLFVVIKRISSSAWIGVDDVKVTYSHVGDIDGDCDVNLNDFAIMGEYWLFSGCVDVPLCGGADLTGDGAVDVDDLAKIAFDWLIFPLIIEPSVVEYAGYEAGVAAITGVTGAADPVSQGWIASPGVGTNTWADGYDSGDGGWRTVDGTTTANSYYQYNISADDAGAMTQGWAATWTVSMDSDAVSANGTVSEGFYYPPNNDRQSSLYAWIEMQNTKSYIIKLNIDTNSDLYAFDGTVNHKLTTDGSAYDNFKTMQMIYDGDGATLSLNGTTVAVNGHSLHTSNRVVMGSGSSSGLGSAIWNSFKITSIQ
ncbi:MAG: hypothetical protein KAS23_09905, partial [Anaerohalosphaera sp.]|nr:hypothetical protein [Anaerohalosphaera sp.]